MAFTGRGRDDDHSNHDKRSAAAVQCSGGLSLGRIAAVRRCEILNVQPEVLRLTSGRRTRPRHAQVHVIVPADMHECIVRFEPAPEFFEDAPKHIR